MKPNSSSLFDGVLARGEVAAAVGDEAWLTAMLQVESALAQVQAFSGLIPQADADAIAACARPEHFDAADLGARAEASGNPVVPLVETLRTLAGPAGPSVHLGATSQDVLDTAGMLVAAQALRPLLADLAACADQAARLAREHRDTRMIGRTLLRQAVPTTFGLKAAGWLGGLDAARRRLDQVRRERLAVQLGGAAGTLAPFGDDGPDLVEGLATILGLGEPVLPWHTERTRIADLAGALGAAAGIVAKVARDLTLMAQDEVDEAAGGSAAADRRDPVAAVCALGSAGSAPGLVASLLAAMAHEHERAAGAWHAEWRPLRELFVCTGSAASWLRTALERLLVHPDVMRGNLARRGRPAESPDAAGVLVDRALQAHAKGL
ncbi:3-carboxy-cis,cis-muconate cycloisomerase [Dactylosporangium aurantiacum]|uniref:3-carboxy-cis,cis-muconate cycloisomerase n=1 Tax=Dactylosporangium aurantiacum TaxID=35754 RepID=A0A9Q9ML26_9ACTN|nr:lyase family protein [Dactylosporangium aurantiacum]MDG6109469.1 lyase family protein [Dactylosporangium aurantiacum]UWZ56396.1 3-carboxy-cis,cis-muconate cycloisomerase [Dactylosporangium aurantiacum]